MAVKALLVVSRLHGKPLLGCILCHSFIRRASLLAYLMTIVAGLGRSGVVTGSAVAKHKMQLMRCKVKSSSRIFNDYWDKMLTAGQASELYYASGASSIRSKGAFTLTRSGQRITISGTVNHHWYDPYDRHAGLGAYVPGHGFISDADALLM